MPAAEPHIVAHFVPLSVIMSDHGGDLASYMAASGSSDVVVTMPVTMDVVGRGTQSFFVAVAVTWHFDSAEPLQDAVTADCPKGLQCLFAWVPADRAGTDEFGIYIDDIGAGEHLGSARRKIAEIADWCGDEGECAGCHDGATAGKWVLVQDIAH